MSRISYADDEEFTGQFALWEANCRRSLRGKRGQMALRELEAALLALPTHALASHVAAYDGQVCAVGAVAARRRAQSDGVSVAEAIDLLAVELGEAQEDHDTETLGVALGMPHLVAWAVVAENDVVFPAGEYVRREGPAEQDKQWDEGGYLQYVTFGDAERYEWVLRWVRSNIVGREVLA